MNLVREISEHQMDWRNDIRTRIWTRQSQLLSESHQDDWLEKIHKDPSIEMFGIEDHKDYHPANVGTCGLTSIDYRHGTAEFSLLIGPEHRGLGYGRKALEMLLDYGFKDMGLRLIYGETFLYPFAAKGFLDKHESGYIHEEYADGELLINPAWNVFRDMYCADEGTCWHRYKKFGFLASARQFSFRDG